MKYHIWDKKLSDEVARYLEVEVWEEPQPPEPEYETYDVTALELERDLPVVYRAKQQSESEGFGWEQPRLLEFEVPYREASDPEKVVEHFLEELEGIAP